MADMAEKGGWDGRSSALPTLRSSRRPANVARRQMMAIRKNGPHWLAL